MGKGRKPHPTAMKRLNGNPGKRPLPQDEPRASVGEPACPDYIRDDAVAWGKWCDLVVVLDELELLTTADGEVLSQYCRTYSALQKAIADIDKHGLTVESVTEKGIAIKRNPADASRWAAEALLAKLEPELGLTASGRTKLKTRKKAPENPLIALAKLG